MPRHHCTDALFDLLELSPSSVAFSNLILSKDSVTVYVSAIMWYKVKDATSAIANVDDYRSVELSSYWLTRCVLIG